MTITIGDKISVSTIFLSLDIMKFITDKYLYEAIDINTIKTIK